MNKQKNIRHSTLTDGNGNVFHALPPAHRSHTTLAKDILTAIGIFAVVIVVISLLCRLARKLFL